MTSSDSGYFTPLSGMEGSALAIELYRESSARRRRIEHPVKALSFEIMDIEEFLWYDDGMG